MTQAEYDKAKKLIQAGTNCLSIREGLTTEEFILLDQFFAEVRKKCIDK